MEMCLWQDGSSRSHLIPLALRASEYGTIGDVFVQLTDRKDTLCE